MAKKVEEKKTKTPAVPEKLFGDPMSKRNQMVLAAAIVIIIIGFYALGQPPLNGFVSMTLAPILLVLGFLVLIPVGLLLRDKKQEPDQQGNVPR
jgi:uncharacterized membrane protein HdeD (DUF308 family)